jgi:NADH-quinone oxidoreductase subunit L
MAFALIVLAMGSVLAGYIGVPHALGGHNQLHAWLEPAFAPPGEAGLGAPAEGAAEAPGGEAAAEAHDETALELALMGVSSGIALIGIAVGWFIWSRRRDIAEALARQFRPVYTLLLHTYYVDEAYDAVVVEPIRVASEEGLWRGADVRLIDGAVNGAGTIVDAGADVLRRLQTGSVRTYAGSVIAGVVVIIGYYLWRS